MKYPFLDLGTVNRPYMADIEKAMQRVLASGRYVGGPEVGAFEAKLAETCGIGHVVGVSNGLDALRLIFKALIELDRLAPGDAVIVPDNTYIASVLAVSDAGLVPVFADASEETLNLDTSALEKYYNPTVKAVLTVHLYGRVCYDAALADFVERHGLLLVEDVAQAIGATAPDGRAAGSFGIASAFSFYPTKNIGALGDAGAVATDDDGLARTVRALANYGSDVRYYNIYRGYNCRLDPLQAAVLNVKLPYLNDESMRRRAIAAIYDGCIGSPYVRKPLMTQPDRCVWHQYCLLSDYRDDMQAYLAANGVGTDINYPAAVHEQPCYSEWSGIDMPVSTKIARSVLCLPISACTSADDAREISKIVNSYEPKI